ncbi:MAG: HAD family hydrolase [Deltaproteobacteria bacterium]|nr:HAD family hydrolase [Deltaproteobacteria bacterium]
MASLKPYNKAIFLDRDGVINVKLPEDKYVARPSELELLPGVAEALQILRRLGYLLVVVTNQRGIGRGFMTLQDLNDVHDFMLRELGDSGAFIDALYHCPHDKSEGCPCRKPEPGLILEASKDLRIDRAVSYTVGDSPSDVAAGRKAGTHTVLLGRERDENSDLAFSTLLDFALYLQEREDQRPDEEQAPKSGMGSSGND